MYKNYCFTNIQWRIWGRGTQWIALFKDFGPINFVLYISVFYADSVEHNSGPVPTFIKQFFTYFLKYLNNEFCFFTPLDPSGYIIG